MEAKTALQSTQPECRRVQRANSSGTVQDAYEFDANREGRTCVVLSYLSGGCHDVVMGQNCQGKEAHVSSDITATPHCAAFIQA